MRNSRLYFSSVSTVSLCVTTIGVFAVAYIGLIAVVMSYATLTVSFSQSMKNDEAIVAVLESEYLAHIAAIESLDYHTAGYMTPVAETFVPTKSMTALR